MFDVFWLKVLKEDDIVSEELKNLIVKMLENDPLQRFDLN